MAEPTTDRPHPERLELVSADGRSAILLDCSSKQGPELLMFQGTNVLTIRLEHGNFVVSFSRHGAEEFTGSCQPDRTGFTVNIAKEKTFLSYGIDRERQELTILTAVNGETQDHRAIPLRAERPGGGELGSSS